MLGDENSSLNTRHWSLKMSRHQPLRTCVACGAKKPQGELVRVVSQGGQVPELDEKGRAPGRGAYLCAQATCVEKAWLRRALERALKLQAPAPPELKAKLLATIETNIEYRTRNSE